MEILSQLVHWCATAVAFVLHFDVHLEAFLAQYGAWTYGILGAIVFCETGLVVTPILPGDSLLFAVGAFAARGSMSFTVAWVVLAATAIAGNVVNYAIGYTAGPKALTWRWMKKEYVDKTQAFFAKYGAKTIVITRFVPIVRTFAPFMAGVGRMPYQRFLAYNVGGGALWVTVCLGSGYLFGNFEVVKKNFSVVVLGIIFVSLLPAVFEWWQARSARRAALASRTIRDSA